MSSRQEEKERRRLEREAQEKKANAAAARTRRLQVVGGVVVGIVIIAAVAFLALGSGGDDASSGSASTSASTEVALPARKIENLEDAAKAAGCTIADPEIAGATHVDTEVEYPTNPPTSGDHNPTPAEDGIYDPGNTPAKENYVHSLEHGRIQFQYQAGAPQKTIDTLAALFNEEVNGTPGYHAQVFENNTAMESPVAAVAWGHSLTCDDVSSESIDAMRAFRERYTDKGPEFVP